MFSFLIYFDALVGARRTSTQYVLANSALKRIRRGLVTRISNKQNELNHKNEMQTSLFRVAQLIIRSSPYLVCSQLHGDPDQRRKEE